MAIMGRDEKLVTEWVLHADQFKKELKDLTDDIRKAEKAERDLTLVKDKLRESMGGLEKAMASLSNTLDRGLSVSAKAAGEALGQLAIRGLSAVGSALKEAVDWSERYAKASSVMKGSIQGAVEATGHAVSVLDLMVAKNKLATLGVKMTDEEFAKFAGDAQKLAGAMGGDLASALESASTALARQSVPMADNIGIIMNAEGAYQKFAEKIGKMSSELSDSEKRLAFQTEFLDQMRAKADALPPPVETLTGALKKAANAANDFFGKGIAEANVQIPSLADSIATRFVPGLKEIKDNLDDVTRSIKEANAEFGQLGAGGLLIFSDPAMAKAIDEQVKMFGGLVEGTLTGRGGSGGKVDFDSKMAALMGRKKMVASTPKKRAGAKSPTPLGLPSITDIARAQTERETSEHANDVAINKARWAEEEKAVKYRQDIGAAVDLMKQLQATQREEEFAAALKKSNELLAEKASLTQTFAVGPLMSFTEGLVQAGIAAAEGSAGFGVAMANMLKSVLSNIASQAAIRGAWEVAQALGAQGVTWGIPNTSSTNHWASAAMFFGIAAAAGAGAVGMGYASKAMGGGEKGAPAPRSSDTKADSYRPSYGKQTEKNQTIVVQMYIGDANDPGAVLFATKQLEARLAKAA